MINRILAGVLLGAASLAASAEWVKVWSEADGSYTVHVDPKSQVKQGPTVGLKILKDYKQQQPFLSPYQSAVEQVEVHCKDETFRDVQAVFYTKAMGQGDAVHKADRSRSLWSPLHPDTYAPSVWQFACKRKPSAKTK